ncbi:MAG: YerC/YecD family TrpR-related protein [bacterium]|nr:YerC/YecD family TrpR-related protein [bacterium]
MARFSLNNLPKEQRIQLIGEFYDAVHCLKSREEVREFFRDLLAPDEIAMFMRRIEIAVLLSAGFSSQKIQELTGTGMGTVTAVRRKFQREGGGRGYQIVANRLLTQRKKRIQKEKSKIPRSESEFERVKKRYPLPFLLFNILEEVEAKQERDSKEFTKQAIRHTPSRKR